MKREDFFHKTYSVCPVCLTRITASRIKEIKCPDCGEVFIPEDLVKARTSKVIMQMEDKIDGNRRINSENLQCVPCLFNKNTSISY